MFTFRTMMGVGAFMMVHWGFGFEKHTAVIFPVWKVGARGKPRVSCAALLCCDVHDRSSTERIVGLPRRPASRLERLPDRPAGILHLAHRDLSVDTAPAKRLPLLVILHTNFTPS